jgi:hypothetical protein
MQDKLSDVHGLDDSDDTIPNNTDVCVTSKQMEDLPESFVFTFHCKNGHYVKKFSKTFLLRHSESLMTTALLRWLSTFDGHIREVPCQVYILSVLLESPYVLVPLRLEEFSQVFLFLGLSPFHVFHKVITYWESLHFTNSDKFSSFEKYSGLFVSRNVHTQKIKFGIRLPVRPLPNELCDSLTFFGFKVSQTNTYECAVHSNKELNTCKKELTYIFGSKLPNMVYLIEFDAFCHIDHFTLTT